jgi:hypothetical protein
MFSLEITQIINYHQNYDFIPLNKGLNTQNHSLRIPFCSPSFPLPPAPGYHWWVSYCSTFVECQIKKSIQYKFFLSQLSSVLNSSLPLLVREHFLYNSLFILLPDEGNLDLLQFSVTINKCYKHSYMDFFMNIDSSEIVWIHNTKWDSWEHQCSLVL